MTAAPSPRVQLGRLITASELSVAEWARTVAGRDERTVRRWLAGDPIPDAAAMWLLRMTSVTAGTDAVVTTVLR